MRHVENTRIYSRQRLTLLTIFNTPGSTDSGSPALTFVALVAITEATRLVPCHCPACRTTLIATRFWVVMICPIIKCLTVLEFSFILFDLCLFITIFNFILNYVPLVTFWIFTYHKILILLIIFCFIWSYWIIYFLTCLEVLWVNWCQFAVALANKVKIGLAF